MSIQNNESEKHRKGKRRSRFRKLISGSGTPDGMLQKDDALTKLVARVIEAWIVTGREQKALAKLFAVSPSNISQLRTRTLGVGNKVAKRIASAIGVSESDLFRIAETAQAEGYTGIESLVLRLAGDKKAALPWLASGEELTLGEREMYEDALRLLAVFVGPTKTTAKAKEEATVLIARAKALGSEHKTPPSSGSMRAAKRRK